MAVLSDSDRAAVALQWMRENRDVVNGTLTKADVRAAVNAMDTWANDNASALNTAIPTPARTVLTSSQKNAMFSMVTEKRYGAGA